MQTHEDFSRAGYEAPGPTDRSFGVVFSVVFTAVGLLPLLSGNPVRVWALAFAALLLLLAFFLPRSLNGANRLWMRFAILLSRVMNPIVIGILYIGVITPIGWFARMTGHDPLKLKFDPSASTYWIERNPSGPSPDSMSRQF